MVENMRYHILEGRFTAKFYYKMWHERCVKYRVDLDHKANTTIQMLEDLGETEARRRRMALTDHQTRLGQATQMARDAAGASAVERARMERVRIQLQAEVEASRDWESWASKQSVELTAWLTGTDRANTAGALAKLWK